MVNDCWSYSWDLLFHFPTVLVRPCSYKWQNNTFNNKHIGTQAFNSSFAKLIIKTSNNLVKYSQELIRALIAMPTSVMAATSARAACGLSTRIVSLLRWWIYLETITSRTVCKKDENVQNWVRKEMQALWRDASYSSSLTNIWTLLKESGAYAITVTHKLMTSIMESRSGSFS